MHGVTSHSRISRGKLQETTTQTRIKVHFLFDFIFYSSCYCYCLLHYTQLCWLWYTHTCLCFCSSTIARTCFWNQHTSKLPAPSNWCQCFDEMVQEKPNVTLINPIAHPRHSNGHFFLTLVYKGSKREAKAEKKWLIRNRDNNWQQPMTYHLRTIHYHNQAELYNHVWFQDGTTHLMVLTGASSVSNLHSYNLNLNTCWVMPWCHCNFFQEPPASWGSDKKVFLARSWKYHSFLCIYHWIIFIM